MGCCMGKILSLKYCTASGNDNWKENPPKYHFSQRAGLSLTGFGTITDINGTVVIVDVDINEVFFEHLLATSASCRNKNAKYSSLPNMVLSQIANISDGIEYGISGNSLFLSRLGRAY